MSLSLGFLLGVLPLLLPLGIALCHGIYDGQNEIADHDQHHFLKDPGEPALTLRTKKSKQTLLMRQGNPLGTFYRAVNEL